MFTSVVKAVAVLALAARGISAALQPIVLQQLPQSGLSQCSNVAVGWSGGAPPFNVFLLANKTGPVIKAFPLQSSRTFDWQVDLPSGTNFFLQVLSSPDADHSVPTATSDRYTIVASSDSSCINTSIVGAPYGATASASSTSSGAISSPSLTTVPATLATSSSPHASSSIKTNKTVPIIIGVVGGLIGLAALTFGIMFCVRRKNQAEMAKKRKSFVGKPKWVDVEDLEIRKPVPTHF